MPESHKERLEFICWSCKEKFSLLQNIHYDKDTWVFELPCPFCYVRCQIDLTPFWGKADPSFRSGDSVGAPDLPTFQPPDSISTTEPTEPAE